MALATPSFAQPASEQVPKLCVGVSAENGMWPAENAEGASRNLTAILVVNLTRKMRDEFKNQKTKMHFRAVSGIGLYRFCGDKKIPRVIISYTQGKSQDFYKIKMKLAHDGVTSTKVSTARLSDIKIYAYHDLKYAFMSADMDRRSEVIFRLILPYLKTGNWN